MATKKVSDLKRKMNDLQKQMGDAAKTAIRESVQTLFDQWPEVEAIRWNQYTPYFNDGDACVFSVNEPQVKIGNEGGDDGDGWLDGSDFEYESEEERRLYVLAYDLEYCEDGLKIAFGDHCQVTIYRDKSEVDIDDYQHD